VQQRHRQTADGRLMLLVKRNVVTFD